MTSLSETVIRATGQPVRINGNLETYAAIRQRFDSGIGEMVTEVKVASSVMQSDSFASIEILSGPLAGHWSRLKLTDEDSGTFTIAIEREEGP